MNFPNFGFSFLDPFFPDIQSLLHARKDLTSFEFRCTFFPMQLYLLHFVLRHSVIPHAELPIHHGDSSPCQMLGMLAVLKEPYRCH